MEGENLEQKIADGLNTEAGSAGTGSAAVAPVETGTGGTGSTAGTASAASSFNDDTEVELEYGEKKEKKKVKLGDLKRGYMQGEDYTKKTQELSTQKEQIKDLIAWSENVRNNPDAVKVIVALTQKGFSNKEALSKVLEVLGEKVEEKKEEVVDEIKEMEKDLESLDPESAEAKILKRNIQFSKNVLKQLKDTQKRLDDQDKAAKTEKEAKDKAAQEGLVKEATSVLNSTIEALCDASKDGGLTFDSDEAKGLWRSLVISHLKDNPKEYASKEEFVAAIREAGKKYHAVLVKHGEAQIAKYLKSKEGHVPDGGAGSGSGTKKKIEPKGTENLQAVIEQELGDIVNSKSKI